MKNSKGITLISLIITIIVMMILAGISLAFSVGENGIISKAEETKTVQANAEELEKVSLAIANAKTSSLSSLNGDPKFDELLIKQAIEKEFGTNSCNVEKVADYFLVTIKDTNNKYKVTADGKVEKISTNIGGENPEQPEENEDIMWVFVNYGTEEEPERYLYFIGNVSELDFSKDKEVNAYLATYDEDTWEIDYNENSEVTTVKLSDCCIENRGGKVQTLKLGNINIEYEIEILYSDFAAPGLVFADDVTEIPSKWFEDCGYIKSITIPSSVTSVGYAAFRNCTGITDITIKKPEGSLDLSTCELTSEQIANIKWEP